MFTSLFIISNFASGNAGLPVEHFDEASECWENE
jgi:hypothetical protein